MRSRLASLITGPVSANSCAASTKRRRNSSYTASKTTILEAAAHRWPAFENDDCTAQRTALSRSASSHTTSAFLPPSSRHTLASRRPAVSAIQRPVAAEPVKLTRSTCGCSTRAAPASAPSPCTTLRTPAGRPTSSQTRCEQLCRERRLLGRLQDSAVAAEDRRKDLPGNVGQRCVERDQQPCDADGLPDGHHRAVRRARSCRPPVVATSLAGDEEAQLDRRIGLAESQRLRLARLLDDDLRKLVAPLPQRQRDLADEIAAFHHRPLGPGLLCRARRLYGSVDIGRPRTRNATQRRAVRRPQLLEPLARLGGTCLSVDEVERLGLRHQADQPPSTTRLAPVTYDEASAARKTTAPSASPASAIRPSGTRAP